MLKTATICRPAIAYRLPAAGPIAGAVPAQGPANTTTNAMMRLLPLLVAMSVSAVAQFKEIGPAPFSEPVAHQKVRALLEQVNSNNHKETVETLTGLLAWYRDVFDEELIAAWQKEPDKRVDLTAIIDPLADPRVASGIVEFSWRGQRQAIFTLTYAPMLGNLMFRYPESAKPFLDDLLGNDVNAPPLSEPEAEAVCRILLDMPDTATWKNSALRILPRYRDAAQALLNRDLRADDPEKRYRAQSWLHDLKLESPALASEPSPRARPPAASSPGTDLGPVLHRAPAAAPPSQRAAVDPLPPPIPAPAAPSTPVAQAYNGPRSGTLECAGGPIPQNAEYVFRNLPPMKMQLDYDRKIWDATLAPSDGQTQKLILRNKSSGPQKRCVVRWTLSQ
jgi:hypothetical protein